MKKKHQLPDLKVQSFVTQVDESLSRNIKAGEQSLLCVTVGVCATLLQSCHLMECYTTTTHTG